MKKKPLFLVTTAIPESWNKKKSMLMVAEWCKFHPEILKVKKKITIIKKHYCSNELNVYQNYKYISQLYEKLLSSLTKSLNQYHDVNFSKKYWRILIGPWLGTFLHIVYDRWLILKGINFKKEVCGTYILNLPEESLVPINKEEFDIFRDNHVWNHFLFSKILQEMAPKKLLKKKFFKYSNVNSCRKYLSSVSKSLPIDSKRTIFDKKFKLPFYKNQKIFIKSSYMGFKNEILLNSILLSWPTFHAIKNLKVELKKNYNYNARKNLNINFDPQNSFEKLITKLIKIQIPQIYLESFNQMNNFIKNCPWPQNPKIILSGNMLVSNSCDMFYLANLIENNKTKLITTQHGGAYGQFKYSFDEEHEIKVSDKFLTWGWKKKNSKNLVPFGMLTNVPINNKFKNKKKILTILNKFSHKYTVNLQPGLDYSSKIKYIKDLKFLLQKLKQKIPTECLQIRDKQMYKYKGRISNTRWYIKDYLDKEEIKGINFDDGSSSFLKKVILESSLFIVLINSTTHLETLRGNYPTLIHFAYDNRMYSPQALKFINKLKKAKIYHDNLTSLTNHATKIWPNVNKWWFSSSVQTAVEDYCNNFARPTENKVFKLKKIIKKYI